MTLTPQMRSIVRKWIKNLRSGKYTQGKGQLRADYNGITEYCCLGVLCDIVKPKDVEWEKFIVSFDPITVYSLFNEAYSFPTELAKNMGDIPLKFDEWCGESLISMNDIKEATFDEIADMLDLWLLDTAR